VKLPNDGNAIVDVTKVRDYVLSQTHPRGRHKARVFLAALELTAADSEELRLALLKSAIVGDAVRGGADEFGALYRRLRNGPIDQTRPCTRLLRLSEWMTAFRG
jgi:hypothetical protein